jgi:hypothetical protein
LLPVIERYRKHDIPKFFRCDAAFTNPTLLETENYPYTIRIKANAVLEQKIEHLLKRHVGRPLQKPQGVLPPDYRTRQSPGITLARHVNAVAIPTFPTSPRLL